jgi:hypothetical protein
MSYAIIALNVASLIGLLGAAILGYALKSDILAAGHGFPDPATASAALAVGFKHHFLLALTATLAALFAESMIFFYFIGTGVSIKKAVALYKLDHKYLGQVRQFKQRTSGIASLALLLLMAAFVLGGGVAARAVPVWGHHAAAWAALIVHGISTWSGAGAILDNVGLLAELDRQVLELSRRGEVVVSRTVV